VLNSLKLSVVVTMEILTELVVEFIGKTELLIEVEASLVVYYLDFSVS
jgi:hypothetical protein